MDKEYTIIAYLRISSEDKNLGKNGKSESDSISNQRLIVQEYVKNHEDLQNCKVVELLDDGYSGTNFDRPGITQAISMLKQGEAQCIIVKDLSRFGRNYIDVGNFLEQVFPFLGVRFIAVNDSYDSSDPSCVGSMVTVFKTMFADLYSKDLSVKVKSALYRNAQHGKYINALAPYGYVKTASQLGTLEIDDEAAEVVRWIFRSFVEGKNKNQIARELNSQMVPTPMQYKENHGCKQTWTRLLRGSKPLWTGYTVYVILRDERYIGTVIYAKTKRQAVGRQQQIKNAKDDWIIVRDMHEGIVTQELFDEAQSQIEQCRIGETKTHKSLLQKKMRCAVCGRTLTLVQGKVPFYYCKTRQYTDEFTCQHIKLYASDVYDAVLSSIHLQAEFAVNVEEILWLKYQGRQSEISSKAEELKRCEKAVSSLELAQKELFQSYFNKQVEKAVFKSENAIYTAKRAEQEEKAELLREELHLLQNNAELDNPFINTIKPYRLAEELTDDMIGALIEDIKVYDDNTLEINWNFSSEFHLLTKVLQE